MQKFLLVAPLTANFPRDRPTPADYAGGSSAMQMRSRTKFVAGDLEQVAEPVPADGAGIPPGSTGDQTLQANLQDVQLIRMGARAFVTAMATVATENRRIDSIEEALTSAIANLVATHWKDVGVKWVSRTRIVGNAKGDDDWMLRDEDTQEVDVGSPCAPQTLALGWGNNQLEVGDSTDAVLDPHLLAGLIDAQMLWVQLDEIAGASESIIKAYSEGRRESLVGAASFKASRRLSEQMALHHLFYDKVLLSLQGVRGRVARAALKSWRYPDVSRRILHRVREIDQLVQQENQASRQKYQDLVENVLLGIGVISLVQLVVVLVQTAYIDGVVKHPETGSKLNLLRDLHEANLNRVVITSIVIALLLYGWILWHKKRR